MPRPSAGLRHRVTIKERITTGDADNGPVYDFVDYVTDEPAAVVPQRGREYYAASQLGADTAYLVVVRYRPDKTYTQTMIIEWEGHVLTIEAVLEQEARGRLVDLMCRERVPEGFRTVEGPSPVESDG